MKHALTKEACRKDLGIPSDDKVVFFPAYNHRLGKHEPYAIQQLLKARSEIPYSFTLLARPYPHRGDFESRFSPILDSKSQTIEPASSLKEDWELMAKLLVASDVILCGPGTVAVEAMFFDRPVVHLALDPKEDKNHQPLYKKYFFTDHYQHVMKHNASDYVQTSQEFISSVVANLSRTESKRVARENTIREQIYFINGSAASNVSSLIQKFLAP
jgi:hypothetical protein